MSDGIYRLVIPITGFTGIDTGERAPRSIVLSIKARSALEARRILERRMQVLIDGLSDE